MRKIASITVLAAMLASGATYSVLGPTSAAPVPVKPGSIKLVDDEPGDGDDGYNSCGNCKSPKVWYPVPEPGYYEYNEGYESFDDCQSDGYIIQDELGYSGGRFYCASGEGPYALYLQWDH